MTPTAPTLRIVRGSGATTAARASLRLVTSAAPSPTMDDTTEFTLACTDTDGHRQPFADVVRAVFNGDADPDDYAVALNSNPVVAKR